MPLLHPIGALSKGLFATGRALCLIGKIDWPEAIALSASDCLSDAERKRAARFRDPVAQAAFVLGRSLARQALSLVAGAPPARIEITLAEHGKPEAPGTGWVFSISHSGPWVAVAFATNAVGCDLELGRRMGQTGPLELGKHICCAQEMAALEHLHAQPGAQRDLFLQIWRRKEAVLKAAGLGLPGAPRSFCVTDAAGGFAESLCHAGQSFQLTELCSPALPAVALARVTTVCAAPTPAPAAPRSRA